ncbi:MAG: GTPase Era [Candidatus Omnitrophica bacterium]|jgi:GTP-binding protein Era|nr:GTPase Era [Candidatus Omnitrophota bacterium]
MINENFKSGFVAIMGRPNVGKSTMLNALLKTKISIVSPIPQTTRHQIKGILNLKAAQVVFVDTPGIHSFKDNLATQLNTIAKQSIEGCDLILYVVDISRVFGKEELEIVNFLTQQNIKTIMVLNKLDLGTKALNEYIDCWRKIISNKGIKDDPLVYYLPISAKLNKNIDVLRDVIVENLPGQVPFYDNKTLTDFPLKFRIADIVREKLFLVLAKELPHSLAVEVRAIKDMPQGGKIEETEETYEAGGEVGIEEEIEDDLQEAPEEEEIEAEGIEESEDSLLSALSVPQGLAKTGFVHVRVNIYVNRPSQKKIVIGAKGELLKEIGREARKEIEAIFNKKVFLDIWVTVLRDWQDKPRILQELGYWLT